MDSLNIVQTLAVWSLPVLFSFTLHEVVRGRVALALGDRTARDMGRLSFNPMKHVDPVGTLLLPGIMIALHSGFMFGWGKPVPIDPRNFKNPRRDFAIVSAVGPLSYLGMAIAWGLVAKLALIQGAQDGVWLGVGLMSRAGMLINLSLMVLNLLPLPPLDGGRVLVGLLPAPSAYKLAQVERYSPFILLLLMMLPGVLGAILYWPMAVSYAGIGALLGLPPG